MKTLIASALALSLASPAAAIDASAALGDFVDQYVMSWAMDPTVIEAIRAQNTAHEALTQDDIDSMDATWRDEVGTTATPTISSVLDNTLSDYLRAQVAGLKGAVTEAFVMDAHGLNVGASATTSDYWQGDEAKFTETFGVGPDARHFSDIEKDESTQTYQAQASFAIADPDTGEVIGAMTVGINAAALQ
ncbi:hypothetical protein [Maritimibacter dapengensis]|uniref:Uncharacterized protein n=1 Tax=Maritimibacter dapengensis TaxID=2836868 RepID=A0ABS6T3X2_9RHOB|nr:hypothetical protein [Maritimibacter dapengensis]MBV7379413.1 hypothetical protein [Maritimibacter dapengensis]